MDRRDFLKGMAASIPTLTFATEAEALENMQVWSGVARGAEFDCLRYMIIGLCIECCPPVIVGYIVRHWLPVALVEVTKAPDDSLFVTGGSLQTGSRIKMGVMGIPKHTFETRIWGIDDNMRRYLTYNLSGCLWCSDNSGDVTDLNSESPVESFLNRVANKTQGTCPISAPTHYASVAIIKAVQQFAKLVYSSELDFVHWRTGCRDISKAALEGLSSSVGDWGPLYPRQMEALGTPDNVSAALTAYRALHLARYDLETFNQTVSEDGLMQPVYPDFGKCFGPGAPYLEVDSKVGSSHDGRYCFIYWKPVTCCIKWQQLASCSG